MWKLVAVVTCVAIGCHPLGPGETRCTTSLVFGTAITHCKTGAPAPVAYAPPPGPAPREPRWWCSSSSTHSVGGCYRDREACTVYRDGMVHDGMTMTACDAQTYADCFYTRQATGEVIGLCSPSPSECMAQRDYVLRDHHEVDVRTDCRSIE